MQYKVLYYTAGIKNYNEKLKDILWHQEYSIWFQFTKWKADKSLYKRKSYPIYLWQKNANTEQSRGHFL